MRGPELLLGAGALDEFRRLQTEQVLSQPDPRLP
jgi:hypothetical protein